VSASVQIILTSIPFSESYRDKHRLDPDRPKPSTTKSRRKTCALLSDLLGVPISLGAVSAVEARVADAVELAVDEAWTKVEGAAVKHTDGTSWLKAGTLLALWTIATTAATVFKIVTDGSRRELGDLSTRPPGGRRRSRRCAARRTLGPDRARLARAVGWA